MTDSAQERTEQPTEKRKRETREQGQIPRSKELNTTLVLLSAFISLYVFGTNLFQKLLIIYQENLSLDRATILDINALAEHFISSLTQVFVALIPICVSVLMLSVVGAVAVGGWQFSWNTLQFKIDRLSPLKAAQKIFSVNGLMELFKSILKITFVTVVALLVLKLEFDKILNLSKLSLGAAVAEAGHILGTSLILISSCLIVIAAIDVPFQIWNHLKQIRMTHQEIKDEFKETEGRPEVRSKIREIQRKLSQRKMLDALADADVLLVNPEHYSVAIKYEQGGMRAPVLVAKGLDHLALTMQQLARNNEVPVVRTPPLARAIYYSTEVDAEIPSGLYLAVAQVLAYVYQLKRYHTGEASEPELDQTKLVIPEELRR